MNSVKVLEMTILKLSHSGEGLYEKNVYLKDDRKTSKITLCFRAIGMLTVWLKKPELELVNIQPRIYFEFCNVP